MSSTPTRFGPYVLLERLSRGGMGEVWRAEEPEADDRMVALKRMLPELLEDPTCVRMFLDEGRIAPRLDHPHVIRTFAAGTVGNEPYIAMEYLPGHPLSELLRVQKRRGAGMSVGLAVYVLRAVCDGLDYVHRATDDDGHLLQLVHRDATPSNVQIGARGEVKLLDFGIAKPLGDGARPETAPGLIKGKDAYLAPEQRLGQLADHRADIFAAGVSLYEALTGRRPESLDPLEPPSRIVPALPAALDAICARALAPEPARRYASAGAMAADLGEIVAAQGWDRARLRAEVEALFTVETATVGTRKRMTTPARPTRARWPILASASVGVVLLATAAVAVSLRTGTAPANKLAMPSQPAPPIDIAPQAAQPAVPAPTATIAEPAKTIAEPVKTITPPARTKSAPARRGVYRASKRLGAHEIADPFASGSAR